VAACTCLEVEALGVINLIHRASTWYISGRFFFFFSP
jgi:hypothetical protein